MSDLGNFLGKVAGKVVNAANTDRKLKCLGKCNGKITDHAALSWTEIMNNEKAKNGFEEILNGTVGVTLDLVPGVYNLTLGNPYACTKCNRVRVEGGIASSELNKSGSYL